MDKYIYIYIYIYIYKYIYIKICIILSPWNIPRWYCVRWISIEFPRLSMFTFVDHFYIKVEIAIFSVLVLLAREL